MYWGEPVHMNLTIKPHKIQPCLREKLCENSSRGNCFLRLCFVAPIFNKRQNNMVAAAPFFPAFFAANVSKTFILSIWQGRKGNSDRRLLPPLRGDGERREETPSSSWASPLLSGPHEDGGTFGRGKPCSPSASRAGDERATARRAPYAVWGGGGNAGLRTGTRRCFSKKLRQKEGDSDRRTQGMISRSDILK